MPSLEGTTTLVVGGSSGIGLGIARAAVEAGSAVTIASRNQDKLDAALEALGGKAEARQLDATDDASVAAFFQAGPEWDHVVTSAGQGGRGLLPKIPMDAAKAAMEAKFWAYFRIARAAKINPAGSLTFISGGLGARPAPRAALVSATNAAVEGLARGLALDMAPVRVNVISPGIVDTPLWNQFDADTRRTLFDKAGARPAGGTHRPAGRHRPGRALRHDQSVHHRRADPGRRRIGDPIRRRALTGIAGHPLISMCSPSGPPKTTRRQPSSPGSRAPVGVRFGDEGKAGLRQRFHRRIEIVSDQAKMESVHVTALFADEFQHCSTQPQISDLEAGRRRVIVVAIETEMLLVKCCGSFEVRNVERNMIDTGKLHHFLHGAGQIMRRPCA